MCDLAAIEARERDVRAAAEQRCREALLQSRSGLLRRMLFRWVLRNARLGVRIAKTCASPAPGSTASSAGCCDPSGRIWPPKACSTIAKTSSTSRSTRSGILSRGRRSRPTCVDWSACDGRVRRLSRRNGPAARRTVRHLWHGLSPQPVRRGQSAAAALANGALPGPAAVPECHAAA